MKAPTTWMIHRCGRSARLGVTVVPPSGPRRSKRAVRRTTGAGECAVPLQRGRERDPAREVTS